MNNQVNNEVSGEDVLAVQASLLIPIIITIFCSALDIIFQLELTKIEIVSFKQGIFWLLTTLISYFFPSFLQERLLCSGNIILQEVILELEREEDFY